ncbi:MAG: glutamylcysteine synthetase [Lachnospiraceae bacterium]|nr:glutamylcysteine synthetase [Lachnospiraceae bacterium]
MNQGFVRQQLYQKYIAPTKEKRKNYIGIEIEMPIINMEKKAVDFCVVHKVTARFKEYFSFQEAAKDENGNIYSISDKVYGDILSYDCSYNNLELSLGREKELFAIQHRFLTYYEFLQKEFGKYDYTLTGMGVNPYRIYNHNVPIPNGRYRMLFHHLNSYKRYDLPMFFHKYPEFGTFSSASQVQLDVNYEELLTTIRAFTMVEPIKALLFSNSVLLDEQEELLCCRDMFWENSTHGINPHNIGMFDCSIDSEEELISYIASTSIYCVEREERYINFPPIKIMEYFNSKYVEGEYYENGTYKKIQVIPQIEDLQYLRTFKFEDLTFRGTIEFRSVCCQPIRDCMTVAAFHLGLKNQLEKLNELLTKDYIIYHQGYTASELRKMFLCDKLPEFVDKENLYELVRKVLEIAKEGLEKRGYGEECLLEPLFKRALNQTNPAKKVLDLRKQGVDIQNIILDYGQPI